MKRLSHTEFSRRGGAAQRPENRTFYRDRDKAREAGRKGGLASGKSRRRAAKKA